jgi:MFS family permease
MSWGGEKLFVIVDSLVTSSILLILFVRDHFALVRVRVGIFGFLHGAIWTLYVACVTDYFPKEIGGTVIGILTLFFGVGTMTGPDIARYLSAVTGFFRIPFGLGAFVSFVVALIIGLLKRPEDYLRKNVNIFREVRNEGIQ